MNADFSSLLRLLESLDGEVRGRESRQPPQEVETLLEKLLSGQLTGESEREEVFELLRREPDWLAWLAGRIKSRRASAA